MSKRKLQKQCRYVIGIFSVSFVRIVYARTGGGVASSDGESSTATRSVGSANLGSGNFLGPAPAVVAVKELSRSTAKNSVTQRLSNAPGPSTSTDMNAMQSVSSLSQNADSAQKTNSTQALFTTQCKRFHKSFMNCLTSVVNTEKKAQKETKEKAKREEIAKIQTAIETLLNDHDLFCDKDCCISKRVFLGSPITKRITAENGLSSTLEAVKGNWQNSNLQNSNLPNLLCENKNDGWWTKKEGKKNELAGGVSEQNEELDGKVSAESVKKLHKVLVSIKQDFAAACQAKTFSGSEFSQLIMVARLKQNSTPTADHVGHADHDTGANHDAGVDHERVRRALLADAMDVVIQQQQQSDGTERLKSSPGISSGTEGEPPQSQPPESPLFPKLKGRNKLWPILHNASECEFIVDPIESAKYPPSTSVSDVNAMNRRDEETMYATLPRALTNIKTLLENYRDHNQNSNQNSNSNQNGSHSERNNDNWLRNRVEEFGYTPALTAFSSPSNVNPVASASDLLELLERHSGRTPIFHEDIRSRYHIYVECRQNWYRYSLYLLDSEMMADGVMASEKRDPEISGAQKDPTKLKNNNPEKSSRERDRILDKITVDTNRRTVILKFTRYFLTPTKATIVRQNLLSFRRKEKNGEVGIFQSPFQSPIPIESTFPNTPSIREYGFEIDTGIIVVDTPVRYA